MNKPVVAKNPEYILWEKQIQMASKDVERISEALDNPNEDELRDLHREMDAKYQTAIDNWGLSLYSYSPGLGTVSDMSMGALSHNLKVMQEKIRAFSLGMNQKKSAGVSNNTEVSVSVHNTVNVEMTFAEVKRQIENMDSLSREETNTILAKIEELEKINSASISKKDKWAKIKPFLAFAADKGVDIGIAILTLILQMNIGI